jgi:hypothetical protein
MTATTAKRWSELEKTILLNLHEEAGLDLETCAKILGRPYESIKSQFFHLRRDKYEYKKFLRENKFSSLGEPMKYIGDALVMSDTEFPYQNSDFINRCVDLTLSVGVTTCIIGGDLVHFGNLSPFSTGFLATKTGKLPESVEPILEKLHDYIMGLSQQERESGMEIAALFDEIGVGEENTTDLSTELHEARKKLAELIAAFDTFKIIIGNHDARYAKTMPNGTEIEEFKHILSIPEDCETSPFYFGYLVSGGEEFQIEHPNNSTKFSARKLASKYHKHILMGHNHQYNDTFDPSGRYWAIEMGHCADETRMPYAYMRHNGNSDEHKLGAVLVKNGYPWHLNELSPWDSLKKML